MGRKAYIAYWSAATCRSILRHETEEMTITQIVQDTWIQPEDIIAALKDMDVMDATNASADRIKLNIARLKAWADMHTASLTSPINVNAFSETMEEEDETDAIDM